VGCLWVPDLRRSLISMRDPWVAQPGRLERVADRPDFRFTAKLWRRFTHERYDYLYPAAELEPWAERTREIAAQPSVEEVYVLTNNHFRGKGITNALMRASMVREERVAGPPPLFDEYGEILAPYADPVEPPPVQ
jgi:uncharacterized protein YecE (DUF72 family)